MKSTEIFLLNSLNPSPHWGGDEILAALEADGPVMRRIRSKDFAMFFQEPC